MSPKTDAPPASVAAAVGPNRRRFLRFDPPANWICTVPELGAHLVVRDISLGGLAAWSTMPIRRDEIHEVSLSLNELTVVLKARGVHCKQHGDGWVVGLAFVKQTGHGPSVEDLIELVTTSRS